MSVFSNPGKVPTMWGYNRQADPKVVKRKYCMMDSTFKPERTHHCSACNSCVLNMDHHCIWINNCVGFSNRKFFLLTLTYAVIMTGFILGSLGQEFKVSILEEFGSGTNKYLG